jgi:hypothetical protein
MEAVAALGVAAAAAQFFGFGVKALLLCKQIRDTGSTEANQELEHHIDELKKIYSELQRDTIPLPAADHQIAKTRAECIEIGDALLKLLTSLKAGSPSRVSNFRAGYRAMTCNSKVKKLQDRLADSQKRFQAAVGVETRNDVALLLERQGKSDDTIRDVLVPELRQGRVESSLNHLKTQQGLSELEISSSTAHDVTQSRLSAMHQDVGEQLISAEVTAKRKEVMDSLWYPDIFNRQQTIKPPSTGTFEWIFDDSTPEEDPEQAESDRVQDHLRGKFARWLRSDELLFWISGKAGSGKSSLMSLIQDDPRKLDALSTWGRGHELYTFSFYFWRPGSALQKSIPGLLRSLLYQLAKAKPAIIDLILSAKSATYNDWTTKSLLAALEKSLTGFQGEHIFLMIDGLDEFEGHHAELLDTILGFQDKSYIKTCVASRPETAILVKLRNFPTLRLQDLNEQDISKFVWDKLRSYEDILTEELVTYLIRCAEGIFLWAALVVKSIISGCEAGDDVATLWLRLDAMPTELAALFEQLLSGVEEVHQESLSLCLYHLNEAHWDDYPELIRSIGLITASLPTCQEISSTDEFLRACTRIADRLVAQWKGLVEIEDDYRSWQYQHQPLEVQADLRNARTWSDHRIKFVHRSAYDFFFSPGLSTTQSHIPWLMQDIRTERMARMTLSGLLVVLRQAAPIVDTGGEYTPNTEDCAKIAIYAARGAGLELTVDFFEWLDDLHANFSTSLIHMRRWWPNFWKAASRDLSAYTESRWDRLMEESSARVTCAKIVVALFDDTMRVCLHEGNRVDLESVHRRLMVEGHQPLLRRLMEHLQKTSKRSTTASVVHTHLIDPEYYGGPMLLSWRTSDTDNEEAVIATLGSAYYYSDSSTEPAREALALMYDWGVYHGGVYRGPRNISPTFRTFCLPLQLHVSEHSGRGISMPPRYPANPNEPGIRSPRYRILCFAPCAISPETPLGGLPMIGHFDLSTETADILSEFRGLPDADDHRYPHFVGWVEEFDGCLELLVDDIWANDGGVLTAWQQLYMLACVKKWFKDLWNIRSVEERIAAEREHVEEELDA